MASSTNKVQPRPVRYVFLGYAAHYKGYWCLDPLFVCVYVSRHVRFHESSYRFPHMVCQSPQLTNPFVFDPQSILALTRIVSSCVSRAACVSSSPIPIPFPVVHSARGLSGSTCSPP